MRRIGALLLCCALGQASCSTHGASRSRSPDGAAGPNAQEALAGLEAFERARARLLSPDASREEQSRAFERLLAECPDCPKADHARNAVAVLRKMIADQEAHDARPDRRLEDLAPRERAREFGCSTCSPDGTRTHGCARILAPVRVCDLAAEILWAVWKVEGRFDRDAPLAERDRSLDLLRQLAPRSPGASVR